MSIPRRAARAANPRSHVRIVVTMLMGLVLLPLGIVPPSIAAAPDHLVVSEVVTGGTSASDELIELYNPTAGALPLEGLELVYVTSTGATISRRAAWELGAPSVSPGSHVLVANESGIYASIADAVYAGGMAGTGGSVALRIQGANSAIDAVGWGTAASTWLEGSPMPAPPAGSSVERLPGGLMGSTVDTDANAADFVIRAVPDPQNAGSPPVPVPAATATSAPSDDPAPTPPRSPTPTPSPVATDLPTPTPMATPTATPVPVPSMPIADARALPDGTTATVEGVALTASDFGDGGGYLADGSGGIAIILENGAFERGDQVAVTGVLDDRFAQRTLRADAATATPGGEPTAPVERVTGAIDESVEGRLVRVDGQIEGGATSLSGGLAFDLDDGSGIARVVVGSGSGIDTSGWTDRRGVTVIGVVGQRDSSGTGTSGYRIQPRDTDDVELGPTATPTPTRTPGPSDGSPTPSATASPVPAGVATIAHARAAAKNARLTVRGLVTLGSGTVDPQSAVIQDATGAILLRLSDEARSLRVGQLVEALGVRSTKSGMESLRVSTPPRVLGTGPEPTARALRTGDAGESAEAQLVVARGALVASARRASSGTVSFEIDDGSGPLRVVAGAGLSIDRGPLTAGAWVEVRGVLGQETTGSKPQEGYRIWPRTAGDIRLLAGPTAAARGSGSRAAVDGPAGGGGIAPNDATAIPSLDAVGSPGLGDLRVGATLVAGAWDELDVAGLLWDGARLVAIDAESTDRLRRALVPRRLPVGLELSHLRAVDIHPRLGVAVVALGPDAADTTVGAAPAAQPSGTIPDAAEPASWVSVVGRLTTVGERRTMRIEGDEVRIEWLCGAQPPHHRGSVAVTGVGLGDPARIIVPCDGIRPAPALTRLASTPEAGMGSDGMSVGTASASASDDSRSGARMLAVALLVAGIALIILATVLRSRLGDGSEPQDSPAEESEAARAARPPQLTLVRLPNERGP